MNKKLIGYVEKDGEFLPFYEVKPGSIVTQAFIHCKYCRRAISNVRGPNYDAVCIPCYNQITGDKRVLYENLWELTDGTAESSSASPTRQPLTDEEINNGMDKSMLTLAETVAFAAGVRYAEQVHRIGEEE